MINCFAALNTCMFAENKKTTYDEPRNEMRISITGGDFVQSPVGSSETVVYKNTNTIVQALSKRVI